MEKLRDFLRIAEAAEYLGVSPNTLRNWENAGKIAAHRHPVNGYVSGQRNLFQLYRPVVNAWWLYDASRLPPSLVASEEDNALTVVQPEQFENIQQSFEE